MYKVYADGRVRETVCWREGQEPEVEAFFAAYEGSKTRAWLDGIKALVAQQEGGLIPLLRQIAEDVRAILAQVDAGTITPQEGTRQTAERMADLDASSRDAFKLFAQWG